MPIKIFQIFLLTYLLLPLALAASSLHVVLIGDSNGFQDQDGKTGLAMDLENVSLLFKEIAYAGNLDHTEVILAGNDVYGSEIYRELNNLKVKKEDVVVFYFTGHGFRPESKSENEWANFFVSNDKVAIDMAEVIQILEEKNPRFMLILSDCCNNIIPDQFVPPLIHKEHFFFGKSEIFKKNIKMLFLDVKGKVVATGAKPGLYSILTSKGSLFTKSFTGHLRNDLIREGRGITWSHVLNKVVLEISSIDLGGDRQVPYFEVDLNSP